MFDVVLHPTDFSPEADDAFHLACDLARANFANLVVVHAITPSSDLKIVPDTDVASLDLPLIQECRDQFQRMTTLARDIPITFRLVVGYPVGAILDVAKSERADLIVIASDRKDQFHLQLHGSVAEGLLRQSSVPVCCLRQPAPNRREKAGGPNVPAEIDV